MASWQDNHTILSYQRNRGDSSCLWVIPSRHRSRHHVWALEFVLFSRLRTPPDVVDGVALGVFGEVMTVAVDQNRK
jgi:hypothetical protein